MDALIAMLVTLQPSYLDGPIVDYTATLVATLTRGSGWPDQDIEAPYLHAAAGKDHKSAVDSLFGVRSG